MHRSIPFMLAGPSLLAMASAAAAQPTGQNADPAAAVQEANDVAAEEGEDEEIVIMARRRAEGLQDVPISVNVATGEDLSELNIRRFEDIQTIVPGLSMTNNANGIGSTASVRGVAYDVNASGNNGTIEFYLNDAPISAGNLFQAMYDIGQVELLRGPQGTLRGRASPSGSMTVTTRRPDLHEIGGYASVTATDIGGFNAQAAVNIPVIEGMLAIRVAGLVDVNDGNRVTSINNTVQDPYVKAKSGRVSVRFDPTDNLTFSATFQKIIQNLRQFDQVESAQIADPLSPPSPVFIEADDRLAVEDHPRPIRQVFNNLNLQAQWSFAGQRLNYVGAMNKQHLQSLELFDPGDFFPPSFPAVTNSPWGRHTDTHSKGWAHEIRLSSEERIAGMFDYIVGGFYQKTNVPTALLNDTLVLFGLPSPFTPGVIVQTPIERNAGNKEISVFGNLTLHLGEATEISGGVRYIDYKARGELIVSGAVVPAGTQNEHDTALIYTGSVKHEFTDDLMVYASIGSSWRPRVIAIGDFSVAPTPLEQSFTQLPPEKSTSYEIGLKSSFLDDRLRLNVAAYHQDFKNYPYRSNSGVFFIEQPAPGFFRVNRFNFVAAVPVRVRGIEADLAWKVTDDWDINATAAFSKSKIKNGFVPCNDYFPRDGIPDTVATIPTVGQIDAATGGDTISGCNVSFRASLAPLWSATVNSEYRVPIASNADAFLRGLVSIYGKSQNDPQNAVDDVKSYALLNLYAGVRSSDGAWEVSAYGKNILNTERVLTRGSTPLITNYNVGATGFAGVTTYRGITMTAPREFGLNLRYAFGSR